MKVIVGLGNPGAKYVGTRHSVGFCIIDVLARRWGVELTTEKFHAWFARCSIGDQEAVLLKPTTFVNRSGQVVLSAGRFYRIVVVEGADHSLSDASAERDAERRSWFDRYVRDLEPVRPEPEQD